MAIVARAMEDRASLAIAMTLCAYLFFAVIDTSVKWLVLAGLPAFQLAFMRYLPHFVISTAFVLRQGGGWSAFGTDHVGLVLLRAFLLSSATLFNFITLNYLSLTITASPTPKRQTGTASQCRTRPYRTAWFPLRPYPRFSV